MAVFNIKVTSDPVCPFCYIGKKRLDRAISLYQRVVPNGSNDTFVVTWHPYYLDPSLPSGTGVPVAQRMAERHGLDNVPRKQEQLRKMGLQDGIHFTFDNKIGNTRDAHRLLEMVLHMKGAEKQNEIVEGLFARYFEHGGDITSWEMLVKIAETAGLDGGEVRGWLEQGLGGDEVDKEVEMAVKAGVKGVPKFEINGTFLVDGAQDVDVFFEELLRAKGLDEVSG